jgi:N-methylhydantoinase B
LLVDYVAGGGGFGDPIDRDPDAVLKDFGHGWVSREIAQRIYGVVLADGGKAVDSAATENCRRQIREARQQDAPISKNSIDKAGAFKSDSRQLLRFHAALEIIRNGKEKAIRCSRCGYLYCEADENYKQYALHRILDLNDFMPPLPTGERYIGEYHIYSCPSCATQLQVDLFSPSLGGDPILWDTRIA